MRLQTVAGRRPRSAACEALPPPCVLGPLGFRTHFHPGYAELAGEFNYNLLSGLVSAQARIGLAINTVKNQFNGEVGARG